MMICAALVFFMTPGLAFFYGGLVRRKNVCNTIMACIAIMGELKSAEILLHEDGSFDMIRRAETPRDYFATFDCFPIFEKMLEDEDRA